MSSTGQSPPPNVDESDMLQCKLVLLGDSGVGKTSIVTRYVQGAVNEYQISTIGAAYLTKYETVDNKVVKFNIWDTAGQEKYRNLAPLYYRDAQAAIVVYDITESSSVPNAKRWIAELKEKLPSNSVQIAIVGNKIDLEEQRQVPTEEIQKFAQENGYFFKEVSAKAGINVDKVFTLLARNAQEAPRRQTIILNKPAAASQKKKLDCC